MTSIALAAHRDRAPFGLVVLSDDTYRLTRHQYDFTYAVLGAYWCLGDSLLSPRTALRVAVEAARVAA